MSPSSLESLLQTRYSFTLPTPSFVPSPRMTPPPAAPADLPSFQSKNIIPLSGSRSSAPPFCVSDKTIRRSCDVASPFPHLFQRQHHRRENYRTPHRHPFSGSPSTDPYNSPRSHGCWMHSLPTQTSPRLPSRSQPRWRLLPRTQGSPSCSARLLSLLPLSRHQA